MLFSLGDFKEATHVSSSLPLCLSDFVQFPLYFNKHVSKSLRFPTAGTQQSKC